MFTIDRINADGFTLTFQREGEHLRRSVVVEYDAPTDYAHICARINMQGGGEITLSGSIRPGCLTYREDMAYDVAIEALQQFVNDDPTRQWVLRAI